MNYAITGNGVPIGICKGISAKYPVQKDHVGFMIGKKGGNVIRIRDKHHVQILIQDDKTENPYFLIRALFQKNLDAACSELAMLGNRFPDSEHKYEMLDKDTYEECEVKTSFLVVPQQFAGALIGPKGSNVKKVAQECGAFIYIQQGDASTGGQPWFQIKGLYTKNIEAAYATLANQVMELANQKEAPTVQGPSAE